ncbi:MAG: hypothetical protein SPD11_04650 [Sphaerochaetaceae bacterium]|nr:hypothetical protein [Sphaerochaetaceae bacterium]
MGLKKQLEQQLHEEELLRLQVLSLERRKESVNSVDELRDVALRLGYNQDGNQVFYFSEGQTTGPTMNEPSRSDSDGIQVYQGIPTLILAGISLIGAVFVVLLAMLTHHLRIRKFRKDGDERGGYYEF